MPARVIGENDAERVPAVAGAAIGEVETENQTMLIGVPREIKTHEYRVGLTPASVREAVAHGRQVLVEKGAGAGIGDIL